ncbi:transporter [Pseudorhodoferax sp. Leaf265]|jgi:zinc transporter|uniref:transporter n=1 Tax=Pseudorhodoferax sp. Leaf265 TaxID=1736315 RepID=UPI0006F946AC|nr:transporter [Pseudorhodoferax sp. Leaf265]KQP18729.1 magnesium transporter CorA [Pseudorhodoferax sp. Leaf265]PZP99506.1 MAG: magnesium transporter CorA [Variovorax paradoxus]PZQ11420.1 MAG: magnesium transporter CorA [Variovorax paradoxus]
MDSDLLIEPTRYGADAHGLVCGYRFEAATAACSIGSDEAAQWLADATDATDAADGSGFIWLHFNLSHAGAERWLQRHAQLPESFFETLHDDHRSTRLERDEAALIAVINDVQFDFAFESSDIATLWIGVDRRLVVTARQSPLRSVDRLRTAIRRGEPLRSTTELLEWLLRAQAEVLVDVVRGVTRRIDEVEDALLAGRLQHKRTRLGVLRRLLVRLQRLLAPEPAALFRLLQHPPAWMVERDVDELRQATEEFSVALRDMAALQERIKLLQEEIAAAVNERTSRSLFVLTVVTVLALPINILAGLFGMNVGGVPLAENPHGFWILVAVVIAFTAVAGWLAFRGNNDR